MKIACIIVTYTSAIQTKMLIQKLSGGHFDFYIHVDKKLDLKDYGILFNIPNVYFVRDRVDVKWGGYASVKATFNALKEIKTSGIEYDFVNLMSGQDYAIKSADYISNFLQQNIGKQFIHYKSFNEWDGVQKRLNQYYLVDLPIFGKFRIQRFLNSLMPKRRAPKNLKLYGYSTFWTLSLDCALYIMNYIEDNPSIRRYFKYMFGVDELIYQTVIMNSDYKHAVVNNNYRYVDWSEGGSRPKFLKSEDFEKIVASDCLFARKFNIDIDKKIFDLIDNYNSEQSSTLLDSTYGAHN